MKLLGNLSLLAGMFSRKFGVIRVVAEATCMKIWGAWIGCQSLKTPLARTGLILWCVLKAENISQPLHSRKYLRGKKYAKGHSEMIKNHQEMGYSYLMWLSQRKRTLLSPGPKRVCRTDPWEKLAQYVWKQETAEGAVSARNLLQRCSS